MLQASALPHAGGYLSDRLSVCLWKLVVSGTMLETYRGRTMNEVSFNEYSVEFPCCRYSPETVESSIFTHASDCWTYAVVLWELFSLGADPWAFESHEQVTPVSQYSFYTWRYHCLSNFLTL